MQLILIELAVFVALLLRVCRCIIRLSRLVWAAPATLRASSELEPEPSSWPSKSKPRESAMAPRFPTLRRRRCDTMPLPTPAPLSLQ